VLTHIQCGLKLKPRPPTTKSIYLSTWDQEQSKTPSHVLKIVTLWKGYEQTWRKYSSWRIWWYHAIWGCWSINNSNVWRAWSYRILHHSKELMVRAWSYTKRYYEDVKEACGGNSLTHQRKLTDHLHAHLNNLTKELEALQRKPFGETIKHIKEASCVHSIGLRET